MKVDLISISIVRKCCIFFFLVLIVGCTPNKASVQKSYSADDLNKLYYNSIADSIVVDPDEILPVAVITPSSDNITWDSVNNKYLLMSFHDTPDSYKAGSEVLLSSYAVWVFCDLEAKKWYKVNSQGVTDWTLRLNQLLGLPPVSGYTHVSGFWVSPDDLVRPAYVNDISKSEMAANFDDSVDSEYYKWFNDNIIHSYFEGAYPWTRIGYTYDWAPNANEKGLSEFQIKQGSKVKIEFTEPLDKFINRLM